jgi:hypothetical protein
MKKLIILLCISFPVLSKAQNGQIISITTDPVNPTTADFVKVYVDLMFTSGSCNMDNQGHNTSGNTTNAYAHHCVGMLTVICNVTDTFDLGYLQAGTHQFDFTLSSGSGGAPCTPGIIPDDTSSINFNVISGVGLEENISENKLIHLFPNPADEKIIIEFEKVLPGKPIEISITDISGKNIAAFSTEGETSVQVSISDFSRGVYFFTFKSGREIVAVEKLIRQ